MGKAKNSGNHLKSRDVPIVLAMVNRGDRQHDIAAWFGVNQGRIKEAIDGEFGRPSLATTGLPPVGSPGPKARVLRSMVDTALKKLKNDDIAGAIRSLERGVASFDLDED